ncbi:MAG: ORF1 protein [Anelloviridae sp.]|nr:MAG: ORF1 protein [Anelloviridae sp.]
MRFRRRRFGRRRRYYRKRRWGWRRRYGRRWRRTAWRRRRVRRWRRSVFRRGGRRARPYRISAWNPRVVRNVIIRGWWPLIQCLEGQEHLRYRPMDWDAERQWVWKEGEPPDQYGYLVQYGGGWGSGEISLAGLYREHLLWRNSWSKGNDGMDLVRYFGCSIKLYPTQNMDYYFWWDTDFKPGYEDKVKEYSQPSVMMMAKNSRIVIARDRAPNRRRIRKLFIPPPSRDTTQWQFQTDFCNRPLFTWAAGLIDLQKPFDSKGSFRNAWWMEDRTEDGNMEYIEKWGRIPPQGDTQLPDPKKFKNDAAGINKNFKPVEITDIYPIAAFVRQTEGKAWVSWVVIYNKTLDRWRKDTAGPRDVGTLRGLVLRKLSAQEQTYKWKEGEFTKTFIVNWGAKTKICTIDARQGTKNPTVEVWDFDTNITSTASDHILNAAFKIVLNNNKMRSNEFGKLGLPKSPHDIDFGHHARFGPFCVKNPPLEFRPAASEPINIWAQYKFFFQFGGEYQPPTGIRDPCVDNPSYPVPQSGSVTHPMYAGKGGLTTKIGASGITLSSLRALCAAPPQEISQSAFLGGQKKEEGEETEETTSESSITSAESSSEGDGSSENEERRARRRRNKRRLRIFLQRLADRPLDHKRRRFSE